MGLSEKGFLIDEAARVPRLVDRMRAAWRAWQAPGTVCQVCASPIDLAQVWSVWCDEREFMPTVNADATPQPPRTDR